MKKEFNTIVTFWVYLGISAHEILTSSEDGEVNTQNRYSLISKYKNVF